MKSIVARRSWWLLAVAAGVLIGACPSFAQEASKKADPKLEEVRTKLQVQKITIDFKDSSLDQVLTFISESSGINFVLDADVRKKHEDEAVKVTLCLKDVPLKTALKMLLDGVNLVAVYRDGVVMVMSREKLEEEVVVQVYDVRDLLAVIQDFPGPVMELKGDDKSGVLIIPDLDDRPDPITPEFLVDLIVSGTGAKEDEGKASLQLTNGLLTACQSRRVHGEIASLLQRLRKFK